MRSANGLNKLTKSLEQISLHKGDRMPRPLEREKPLQRVNVMLDVSALESAQKKAALSGISPSIAGSTSAFIRWLIDAYNENKKE